MIIFDKDHVAIDTIRDEAFGSMIPKYYTLDFGVEKKTKGIFIHGQELYEENGVMGLILYKNDSGQLRPMLGAIDFGTFSISKMKRLSFNGISFISDKNNFDALLIRSIQKHDKSVLDAYRRITDKTNNIFKDCYGMEEILTWVEEAENSTSCQITIQYN